jgi:hypothetical protein
MKMTLMKLAMRTAVMKLAIALAVAAGVALGTTAGSLTGATAAFAQQQCIPHYDSSGAQTAPYC